MSSTALAQVVELNEAAKQIRQHSVEFSLRALGAIAKSRRAGNDLRGFSEVAGQMQAWSRELSTAVDNLADLSAQQVNLVSGFVRRGQLLELLRETKLLSVRDNGLLRAVEGAEDDYLAASSELKRFRRTLADAIEGLSQLSVMASVLSRAALIEAASGADDQRRELTIVSKAFAQQADAVGEIISKVMSSQRSATL